MTKEKPFPFHPFFLKVLTWGALFGVLYMLRSFALLIFLTFVFAYIQSNGVERLSPFIKSRIIRTSLVGMAFLFVLVLLVNFLLPRVQEQAETFIVKYPSYMKNFDLQLAHAGEHYSFIDNAMPELKDIRTDPDKWHLESSPVAGAVASALGWGEGKRAAKAIETIKTVAASVIASVSAFLLALLFSFLIVLDLPKLAKSTQDLKTTKLAFVYHEVGDNVHHFAQVLGRALEAQLFIALLNTVLTALGLWMLGLHEKVAFISVIVFICSFIPVAGVFISSAPICLLALQEGGVQLMLLSVVLITVIHMIEAYILNPKIYGHHLRMNPVIVLIILTLGGKMFGVWGLILGVPICTYIFGHAIREPEAAAA